MDEDQVFTVIASLTKLRRRLGRLRWSAEVCDPASPVAGLTAYGAFRRSAQAALARAVWETVRDGSAGVKDDQVHDVVVVSMTSERFAAVHRRAGQPV